MDCIELKTFRQQHKIDFVDWNKPAVKAGGLWYAIKMINVGGVHYPYVMVPEITIEKPQYTYRKMNDEIRKKIRNAQEYKRELKNISYLIENDEYFVTGIGDKSIKAIKNNNSKPEYFWYNTEEGQRILEHLMGKIGQMKLIING